MVRVGEANERRVMHNERTARTMKELENSRRTVDSEEDQRRVSA